MTKRGISKLCFGILLFLNGVIGVCYAQDFPAQRFTFTNEKTFQDHFTAEQLNTTDLQAGTSAENVKIENNLLALYLTQNKALGASIVSKKLYTNGHFEFQMRPSCAEESQTSFSITDDSETVFEYQITGQKERNVQVRSNRVSTSHDLSFNACERMHSYAVHVKDYQIFFLVDNRLITSVLVKPSANFQLKLQITAKPNSVTADTQTQVKSFLVASNRAERILEQLTLDEKLSLLGGQGDGFTTPALPNYGIPSLTMTDGPVGIRFGDNTAFPASIALAATFNREMAALTATQIAKEAIANNKRILLGPCVNMARIPIGGRVFESFGEDPYLSAELAKNYVSSMQAQGVMTSIKHFLLNEQEYNRMTADVQIDEKVLRELYLPPFEAAIEVGATTVMASYNKVRGLYSSENPYLLTDLLKKDLGFKGLVISDWGATHSSAQSALAGLDIEMPYRNMFGDKLKQNVLNGTVPMSVIDEKIRRVLYSMEELHLFENKSAPPLDRTVSHKVARQSAQESLVLLKNDKDLLPLNPTQKLKVALIGPSANTIRTGGGGSSSVFTTRRISPLQALTDKINELKSPIELSFSQGVRLEADPPPFQEKLFFYQDKLNTINGFKGEYFKNPNLEGAPAFTRVDPKVQFDWAWNSPNYTYLSDDNFSVRWTTQFHPTQTGEHEFIIVHDDGFRLFVNDTLVVDAWHNENDQGGLRTSKYILPVKGGETYNLKLEYVERDTLATMYFGIREPVQGLLPNELQAAVDLAQQSDVALVFVGLNHYMESEGFDRKDFFLPQNQIDLIQKVSAVNPRTVVVLQTGSPVDLAWSTSVASLLQAWYPGEEGSRAIIETLLGYSNPSGKLPMTFPKSLQDVPAMADYPGQDKIVTYSEGMHLGYRGIKNYYYPFGFGLSYSKFEISNVQIETPNSTPQDTDVRVSVDIKNTSDRKGLEVLQIYLQHPETQDYMNLKAFEKISINAKSTQTVQLRLSQKAFEQYDKELQKNVVYTGSYKIFIKIGTSIAPIEKSIDLKNISQVP